MNESIKSSKELKKQLKNVYLPLLYSSYVNCGFPSPAEDYVETPLDLNELLITKPAATFFVKAKGESMTGAGIFDGDLLIVDRSINPINGQVILAVVNGEFTLKSFLRFRGESWLKPENPKFMAIKITEEMDFQAWGVVTYSIHRHSK